MIQKETPDSPMIGGQGVEVSKTLFYIDTEVDAARSNKEWRREYMTLGLLKQDCRKEGRAEEREKVVLNILNSGMEEAVVANIAELSIAEVQTIRKKNNL